jgi:hypothetical protein
MLSHGYTRMLGFLGFASFEIFLNGNIVLYSETQYSS